MTNRLQHHQKQPENLQGRERRDIRSPRETLSQQHERAKRQYTEEADKAKQEHQIVLAARCVVRAALRYMAAGDKLLKCKTFTGAYVEMAQWQGYLYEVREAAIHHLVTVVTGFDAKRGKVRSASRRKTSKSK